MQTKSERDVQRFNRGAQDAVLCLYCFARPDAVRAIGDAGAQEGPALEAIEVGDVAAVFSPAPADEFGDDADRKNFEDPSWVIPRACRHDQVIKHVMEFSPVLPVRFGSVFASPEFLRAQLAKRGREISWFLEHMSDKEEWSVSGFGRMEETRDWVLRTDPDLLRKQRHAPVSPGALYLHERHMTLQAEKQGRQVWSRAAEKIGAELAGRALQVCPLRLRRQNPSEPAQEMLFHSAFLLDRGDVTDFRARVESAEAELREQGLSFEATGPWPPYNFCPPMIAGAA